jgi:hypothetical protein
VQVLQPSSTSSGVQHLQSQHTSEPEHLLMNVGGPVQPESSANVFPCSHVQVRLKVTSNC